MSKATNLLQYMNTHNTAVVLLQKSLVTDASTMRLGRGYQVFYQPHQQGGSQGIVILVRKDIPVTLIEAPHNLGEQVDTLCFWAAHTRSMYTMCIAVRDHI